VLDIALFFI